MTSIERQDATASTKRSTSPSNSVSSASSSGKPTDSNSTIATTLTSSPGNSSGSLPSPTTTTNGSGSSSSILINRSEQPKLSSHNKNQAEGGFKQSLKAAFLHPPAPGKLAKTDGKPLGKSFIRQTPINVKEKIQGGEILEWDPRGRDASVGDGIKAPEFLPSNAGGDTANESAVIDDETVIKPSGENENQQTVDANSVLDHRKASVTSATTSTSSIVPNDSSSNRERHSSIASSTSNRSSSQNGSGSRSSTTSSSIHAIKFAPLPTSGRLKRANSITIGVAARSQLLHSQGTGRSWQSQQRQQPHPMQPSTGSSSSSSNQTSKSRTASTSSSNSNANSTSKDKRSFLNTEDELKKGASRIWRRMRSTSSGSSKSSKSDSSPEFSNDSDLNAASTDTSSTSLDDAMSAGGGAGVAHVITDESGHATPKRPSSPHYQEQHQSSHLSHEFPRGEETEEGARTPKIQPHHPPLTRRVSTGAYLRDQSIRGMQDERRKEFIGDVDEFRNLDPSNHSGFSQAHEEVEEHGQANGAEDKGLIANWMASLSGTGAQTEVRRSAGETGPTSFFGGISNPFSSGSQEKTNDRSTVSVVDPPSSNENKEQFREVEGDQDEDEDEDEDENDEKEMDEEEMEAERLAQEAFEHSKLKGVGKEKVSGKAAV